MGGAMPRRVVSTSGSSGMEGVMCGLREGDYKGKGRLKMEFCGFQAAFVLQALCSCCIGRWIEYS